MYHPEANTLERKIRDLKVRLAVMVEGRHQKRGDALSTIRFAMNSEQDLRPSSSFGRELRSPGEVRSKNSDRERKLFN